MEAYPDLTLVMTCGYGNGAGVTVLDGVGHDVVYGYLHHLGVHINLSQSLHRYELCLESLGIAVYLEILNYLAQPLVKVNPFYDDVTLADVIGTLVQNHVHHLGHLLYLVENTLQTVIVNALYGLLLKHVLDRIVYERQRGTQLMCQI